MTDVIKYTAPELTVYILENVSFEKLRELLEDVHLSWAYAERTEDTGLGTVEDLLAGRPLGTPPEDDTRPGVHLSHWLHGRAFGPEIEIAWWTERAACRARVLTTGVLPQKFPSAVAAMPIDLCRRNDARAILLHGTYDKKSPPARPTWSEQRIPRYLAHPVLDWHKAQPPRQVVLRVQDYARGEKVVITRWLRVAGQED